CRTPRGNRTLALGRTQSRPRGGGTDQGTFRSLTDLVDGCPADTTAGTRAIRCRVAVLGGPECLRQCGGPPHLDRQTTLRAAAGHAGATDPAQQAALARC